MKQGNIISIGGAYIDINVPNFPISSSGLRLESEVIGGDYQLELGGSAVNFARLTSSLGVPTTFIGKVGKDRMGSILSDLLIQASVRPGLIQSSAVSTNIGFNMISSEGKSIMAVTGTANQSLTAEEVYEQVSEQLPQSSFLFIGGCFKLKKLMPAFVRLADDARNYNVKVVLDHGRVTDDITEEEKDAVRQLVMKADYYLPSAEEFMKLWNVQSIEEGLSRLSSQGLGFIAVKNSDKGVIGVVDQEIIMIPAFPVEVIHTIGAGDSFDAGFIAARYNKLSLTESIRFGCAAAALKISQESLPSYDDVILLSSDQVSF